MKQLLALVFSAVIIAQSTAQTGNIRGTVKSLSDGEPLIGVPIKVKENQSHFGLTDLDGNYSINNIATGQYTLICSYPGFQPDTTVVTVEDGETTIHDVLLSDKLLDVFVVTAKVEKGNVGATIQEEKNSGTVTDVQGQEDIRRSGESTAAGAAAKVTGVSVEGGKYVYVRGLSDRYSKTLVNGAVVPGLDPNRNSVQMDLFPSNLIERIKVYKSFSPDLPGSFTGGLVNIETRDYPEDFTLSFRSKLGYNTRSSFNDNFITESRGSLDWLGFDDGSRALPSDIPYRQFPDQYGASGPSEELNEIGQAFDKDFAPVNQPSLFDQSYSFSAGNQYTIGKEKERTIGFMTGISYSRQYEYYEDGFQGRYKLTGSAETNEDLNAELELNDQRGSINTLWGAMGNLSIKLNPYNKFNIIGSRFQNGTSTARYLVGNDWSDITDSNTYRESRAMIFQERGLSTLQLKGEHLLGAKGTDDSESDPVTFKDNWKLNWIVSGTQSYQNSPDLRFFSNDYTVDPTSEEITNYEINPAIYPDPTKFYRFMLESNYFGKADLIKPIQTLKDTAGNGKEGELKFGVAGVYKDRVFNDRQYEFNQQSGSDFNYNGDIEEYLADENFDIGRPEGYLYATNATDEGNSYASSMIVIAGYGMADFYLTDDLRLLGGARVEQAEIVTRSYDPSDSLGYLNNLDLLPALNLSYDLVKDTMKVRLAYTRTLARPTFRELAPFASFEFQGGNIFVGNPGLQRTLVDNIDFRWEMYPKYNENISVGAYYKRFINPIERTFNPEAANPELTWRNVDQAILYGVEVEFRKSLGFISEALSNTTLGGNFSLIQSKVEISEKEYQDILVQVPDASRTRTMFGQSPYLVNGFLNYHNDSAGIDMNINFGVSGEKLVLVNQGGTPNIYDQPRPALHFNVSKEFGEFGQYTLRFQARNLLDPEYEQVYRYKGEEYTFSRYWVGRTFSLSFRYTFDKARR